MCHRPLARCSRNLPQHFLANLQFSRKFSRHSDLLGYMKSSVDAAYAYRYGLYSVQTVQFNLQTHARPRVRAAAPLRIHHVCLPGGTETTQSCSMGAQIQAVPVVECGAQLRLTPRLSSTRVGNGGTARTAARNTVTGIDFKVVTLQVISPLFNQTGTRSKKR